MVLLIIFGDRGLVDYLEIKEKSARLKAENSLIAYENERLRERIVLLGDNREYLEMVARKELGMIREGEIVYRFREH